MFLCEEYGGIRIEGFIQSSMHVVIASENGLAYISQLVLIIFGMSHQLSCLVVLSPNTTTDCFCFQFSSGQFFVAFAVSWALSFFITVFFFYFMTNLSFFFIFCIAIILVPASGHNYHQSTHPKFHVEIFDDLLKDILRRTSNILWKKQCYPQNSTVNAQLNTWTHSESCLFNSFLLNSNIKTLSTLRLSALQWTHRRVFELASLIHLEHLFCRKESHQQKTWVIFFNC